MPLLMILNCQPLRNFVQMRPRVFKLPAHLIWSGIACRPLPDYCMRARSAAIDVDPLPKMCINLNHASYWLSDSLPTILRLSDNSPTLRQLSDNSPTIFRLSDAFFLSEANDDGKSAPLGFHSFDLCSWWWFEKPISVLSKRSGHLHVADAVQKGFRKVYVCVHCKYRCHGIGDSCIWVVDSLWYWILHNYDSKERVCATRITSSMLSQVVIPHHH